MYRSRFARLSGAAQEAGRDAPKKHGKTDTHTPERPWRDTTLDTGMLSLSDFRPEKTARGGFDAEQ